MNALLINGSPRKNFNTAKLLNKAQEGATLAGADTEIIHLYDYTFQGCLSCFACKLKGNKTNGLCADKDELRSVLEKAQNADVIILGTPVYYDYPTAQMRAFMERFLFPIDTYMINPKTKKRMRFLDKIVPSGIIYTMNCPEFLMEKIAYPTILGANEKALNRLLGHCEPLYTCDTYQYSDYSKYDCDLFDEKLKAEMRSKQFPLDCEKAFNMGKKLVEMASK